MTTTSFPAHNAIRLDGTFDPQPSRWLWLVKMFLKWLLAVPHLLIVTLIMGTLLSFVQRTDVAGGAFSVLNVLVVIAGVFLLITARYPRPLFDLLIGLNRWVYRVVAYVAFMHDEYPPFRLDMRECHVSGQTPLPESPHRDAPRP